MVRHYLNLSRIERGTLEPVRTRVAVREEVLAPALESLQAETEARQMRVENEVDATVAADADINMTREIFENLLGNAVKYGRDGGRMAVKAAVEGDRIRFSVWNEGEGIPRGKEQELFRKFHRGAGTASAQKAKGTGLGLFITKAIIEAHGGRIEARSEPGQWAEFVFTLPRAKAEAAAEAKA
jgi:signal transduction histidine kinase